MNRTIVEMDNIVKSFAGIKALNDVHLDLREGELHALMGENGAGKSTFYDLVIKDDPLMKNAPFINMDNIAKEISEPDENPNDNMLSAGKITYEEVEKHLESRTSFVYETTEHIAEDNTDAETYSIQL